MSIEQLQKDLTTLINHCKRQIKQAQVNCDGHSIIIYKAKLEAYKDIQDSLKQ